jgi:small subunit ribosomal protein S1
MQSGGAPGSVPSQVDEDLQREIDEALGDQNIEALMEQSAGGGETSASAGESGDRPPEFHHEVRRGRIAAIRGEDVFVELAGDVNKLQGVVPLQQFERQPRLGSIMDFVVERVDEGQGLVYLSREGAVSRATWDHLQRGAIVDARVVSHNKGGLELEMVGGIRAFMPASQVDLHHVDNLEALIGQKFEAQVQEIDRKGKKVVLSRRALLQMRRAEAKKRTLEELKEGDIREGTVSNIVDFGAFVDIGGVDGLVHVSDLSYTHIDKPADAVKVGQQVRVKVLKIDQTKGKISLGLKQVEPDPWQNVGERVQIGESISCRVVRTAAFGAFVEVEPGVEGLLPLSEMSWKRIGRAEDVVQVGQVVHVKVLTCEPGKRRLSLSLKQAQGDPWIGAERKYKKGTTHEGKVIGTTDFGAFVELEPGIEGMVHISELSAQRVGAVTDVVNVGDVKPFRILETDEEQRRIRLSLKPESAGARAGGDARQTAPSGKHAAQSRHQPAARRKPRSDLKSGLGDGGGMGTGLGGLRLEDLK